MAAEIKRVFENKISRLVHNQFEFKTLPGATLEEAKRLDAEEHKFAESANYYHTVLESASDPKEKFAALMGVTQQLINMDRFSQAEEVILKSMGDFEDEPYFRAACYGKLGWIMDGKGNYESARNYFEDSRRIITEIDEDKWKKQECEIYSTAVHFLGRANYGLAMQTKTDRKELLKEAEYYFQEHLDISNLGHDEKAFSNLWMARCQMQRKKYLNAELSVDKAHLAFEDYLIEFPNRTDVYAKLFLVKGELNLRLGNYKDARKNFEDVFKVNSSTDASFKRNVAGFGGIALTFISENNLGAACIYGSNALRAYFKYLGRR